MAIDYNMSDKDQIRGRWIYNKFSSICTRSGTAGVQRVLLSTTTTCTTFRSFITSIRHFKTNSEFLQPQREWLFRFRPLKFPAPWTLPPVITLDELGYNFGPTRIFPVAPKVYFRCKTT